MIPVEWITEEHAHMTTVETRYVDMQSGKRTHSRDATSKLIEKKVELLERQLRGETPTEDWDRTKESLLIRTHTAPIEE